MDKKIKSKSEQPTDIKNINTENIIAAHTEVYVACEYYDDSCVEERDRETILFACGCQQWLQQLSKFMSRQCGRCESGDTENTSRRTPLIVDKQSVHMSCLAKTLVGSLLFPSATRCLHSQIFCHSFPCFIFRIFCEVICTSFLVSTLLNLFRM